MDRHITINHFLFLAHHPEENLFHKISSRISLIQCDLCNMNCTKETIHLFKPEHSSVTKETWLCMTCADVEFGEGNWTSKWLGYSAFSMSDDTRALEK